MTRPVNRPVHFAFALLLAFVGAQAVHWLLTPSAQNDASTARTVAVVLQALVGLGAAAWLLFRARSPRTRA